VRLAIALVVLVVLAIGGLIVHKESRRRAAPPVADCGAPVATLTVGVSIDIDAAVPRTGHTVVMFTADF
jgi:hypothetical protein